MSTTVIASVRVDNIHFTYPFQITQTMINGRRFFWSGLQHYESKALALLQLQKVMTIGWNHY